MADREAFDPAEDPGAAADPSDLAAPDTATGQTTPEEGDPIRRPSGSHALGADGQAVADDAPFGEGVEVVRDGEPLVGRAEGPDTDDPGVEDDSAAHDGARDDVLEGDKELVAVGAPATVERAGGLSDKAAARAQLKKDKATPRRDQLDEKEPRTGPVKFLRESVSELQKVVYPTGQQLINYFIVVLIFVLFIIAIVSLLDLAFGKAIIAVFS